MTYDQTFELLQSRTGGLVRLKLSGLRARNELHGKIGLLVRADEVDGDGAAGLAVTAVEVLIDGNVHTLYVYPHELEFIGAEDA